MKMIVMRVLDDRKSNINPLVGLQKKGGRMAYQYKEGQLAP